MYRNFSYKDFFEYEITTNKTTGNTSDHNYLDCSLRDIGDISALPRLHTCI